VSKHSGKIIVVWLILIVVMSYGALQVFTHTNFNISNGFGSSDSRSSKAALEAQEYFHISSSGSPSGKSQVLIVTQNTSVTTSSGFDKLINFQDKMKHYLAGVSCYNTSENIVSTEMTAMDGFSSGMKQILASNANTIKSLNLVGTGVNTSANLFLNLELNYFKLFNSTYKASHDLKNSENVAFNGTINETAGTFSKLLSSYVRTFSSYVNSTVNAVNETSILPIVQESSIKSLEAAPFNNTLSLYSSLLNVSSFVIANQNLTEYASNPSTENVNMAVSLFKLEAGSSLGQVCNLIVTVDHNTIENLTFHAYNLSQPATSVEINNLTVLVTEEVAKLEFFGNALFSVNMNVLPGYFNQLLTTTNSSKLVLTYMTNYSLYNQPVVPTSYLLHNFVGYNNSTVILVYTFNGNYTTSVGNNITAIASSESGSNGHASFLVAGSQELASQLEGEILSGLVKAIGVGVILSIIIVGLFFRSVKAAILPILMFIISTIISLGIIGYLYTYILHSEVSFITPTLLLIFILGLTSDYSVYIMARYRSELRKKSDRPTVISSRWAGHAVFTSGLTVILSEVVLWLANIPFFSDTGLANAIGVTVTLIMANTFLMAVLHRYGKGIFKKAANGEYHEGSHTIMHKVGLFSTKNKVAMVAVFVVIALVGVTVYEVTPTSIDLIKLLPSSPAITGIELVNNSFNGDFFDRGYIIVQLPQPLVNNSTGNINVKEMSQVYQIENKTKNTDHITAVFGPGMPFGYFSGYSPSNLSASQQQTYIDESNTFISTVNSSYVEIVFQTYYLGWGTKAINTIEQLNTNITPATTGSQTYTALVGGLTASLGSSYHSTSKAFNELLPILAITIFVVLLIQLSSLLTPLRLIFMVMAAVVASLSVTYAIFHYLQGFPVIIFMPVFVFITLLAVGVDYDVFMITRVKEEVMKGVSVRDAIVTSVTENGGVIMLLGTLLFVTFAALYFSSIPLIQEIGIAVGLGVLVDTFISWSFFIPAVMYLMNKYNWWPSHMETKKD
jgi:RND superfamily putative drug exporter